MPFLLTGIILQSQREVDDGLKRELLNVILDNILVDYDNIQKLHKLTINFKIPVFIRKEVGEPVSSPFIYIRPAKRGGKSNQNRPVPNYSTVTEDFPTNPHFNEQFDEFVMKIRVSMLSSNLWESPYSPLQTQIYNIICRFHDEDGWNFKQISDWLIDHGYKTPRGYTFTHTHAWSIYRKKNISIDRFNRKYPHHITDFRIDNGNYFPPKRSVAV